MSRESKIWIVVGCLIAAVFAPVVVGIFHHDTPIAVPPEPEKPITYSEHASTTVTYFEDSRTHICFARFNHLWEATVVVPCSPEVIELGQQVTN